MDEKIHMHLNQLVIVSCQSDVRQNNKQNKCHCKNNMYYDAQCGLVLW